MVQLEARGRISILQKGIAVPRFPQEPLLSSAGFLPDDVKLERHRASLQGDGVGTTCGYQICLNVGREAPVTWKVGARIHTTLVERNRISLSSDGHLREVSWATPMELVLVSLSARLMTEFSMQAGNGKSPELSELRAFEDPQLSTLLRLLHAVVASRSPGGSMYGEQVGNAIAAYLMQHFAIAKPRPERGSNALPGLALRRVLDLIEDRLETALSLGDLAAEARISRFHFARLFRTSVGLSPALFVRKRRVEKAQELLRNAALSLPDVAIASGFSSQSRMNIVFRKLTGHTPAKFRELIR